MIESVYLYIWILYCSMSRQVGRKLLFCDVSLIANKFIYSEVRYTVIEQQGKQWISAHLLCWVEITTFVTNMLDHDHTIQQQTKRQGAFLLECSIISSLLEDMVEVTKLPPMKVHEVFTGWRAWCEETCTRCQRWLQWWRRWRSTEGAWKCTKWFSKIVINSPQTTDMNLGQVHCLMSTNSWFFG